MIFSYFSASETPEESQARKEANNKQTKDKWAGLTTREKRDRTAKSNAQRDMKRIAEDEVTAADRKIFEAAQRKKLRSAP